MKKSMSKPMVLLVAALASCGGVLGGCGEGSKDGTIVESAESKQANASGQDAMKAFMQTKGKKGAAAPAAPTTPAATPSGAPSKP